MDIDFHFGTIYVLTRWAGFNSADAKAIATSSQLVDDNMNSVANRFGGRISGHDKLENITADDQNDAVWIPFHFLPGLNGTSDVYKLTCHTNHTSLLAQKLVQSLPTDNSENLTFIKLGVALHTYADTWAHQEFTGTADAVNIVTHLQTSDDTQIENLGDQIEHVGADMAAQGIGALGHMSALHCPDRPYLQWSSSEKFSDGRKNWEEFTEAVCEIYKILTQQCSGSQQELPTEKQQLISQAFQTIQDNDCDERNREWIDRIQNNQFGFSDFDEQDQKIIYDQDVILGDDNFRPKFFQAIEDQYQWVKGELDGVGIHVLD